MLQLALGERDRGKTGCVPAHRLAPSRHFARGRSGERARRRQADFLFPQPGTCRGLLRTVDDQVRASNRNDKKDRGISAASFFDKTHRQSSI